ncbi:MAG: hypothetical protein WAN59_12750 [Candidatus Baltobacteraceae bacterium]
MLLAPSVRACAVFIYADDARTTRLAIDEALLNRERVAFDAVGMSEHEITAAVTLGMKMDDAEAETLAIAGARHVPALSDDTALARAAPAFGVAVETTLDLLLAWSKGQESGRVARAAQSLRLRGCYAPARSHPLRQWLLEASRSAGGVDPSRR